MNSNIYRTHLKSNRFPEGGWIFSHLALQLNLRKQVHMDNLVYGRLNLHEPTWEAPLILEAEACLRKVA